MRNLKVLFRERPVLLINTLKGVLLLGTSLGLGLTDMQIDTVVGVVVTALVVFSGLTSWETEQVARLIKNAEARLKADEHSEQA